MTHEEIAKELSDLNHNIGVLERTEIGMNNYKSVLAGYRKTLRDIALILNGIFDQIKAKES